jgi:hypothetical protein
MGQGVQQHRIGGTRPTPVEQDQPREGRQRPQEQGDPRVLPGDVDVAETPEGQHQVGRPLSEDLVGDPIASQPRILGLYWLHDAPLGTCAQVWEFSTPAALALG